MLAVAQALRQAIHRRAAEALSIAEKIALSLRPRLTLSRLVATCE